MKSLFFKEFRQGRLLLVFALVVGLLIPLFYWVLAAINPVYRVLREDFDTTFGWLIFIFPPIVALFAGSGLFSAEADRGTLPALFSLPVSRRRIWLAKVLAGVALTLAASALLLAIDCLLLPQCYAVLPFLAYLPDLCLWTLFVLSVAIFASTLAHHAIASLALTILLSGGIAAGVLAVHAWLTAPLLGYSIGLDIALWCFAATPSLLLASALVITRGELLQSARKLALSIPTLLIGLFLTVLVISGFARWATRYQRQDLAAAWGTVEGSRMTLTTLADQVPFERVQGKGWLPHEPSPYVGGGGNFDYRSNYGFILDLTTGRELAIHRLGYGDSPDFRAFCSPDGRFAALFIQPPALTWGTRIFGRRPVTFRLFDLQNNKPILSGLPDIINERRVTYWHVSWSPSSAYLLLPRGFSYSIGEGRGSTLYLLRPETGEVTRLDKRLTRWQWSPNEDILYGFDRDAVLWRVYPDDRTPEEVWRLDARGPLFELRILDVSPDGRWFVCKEERDVGTEDLGEGRTAKLCAGTIQALRADGAESHVLWEYKRRSSHFGTAWPAWSADGNALYLATRLGREDGARILRWRPGDPEPFLILSDFPYSDVRFSARPNSGEMIVWAYERKSWPPEIIGGEVLLVDAEGRTRHFPSPDTTRAFARGHAMDGFDPQGRAIVHLLDGASIKAVNLDTGEMQQIYP
ncbi:MAG: ABC transporter permease [Armatimonadota bacterium]|nr:MAG: ABC transporter permease [Armatimonadota bacterium]